MRKVLDGLCVASLYRTSAVSPVRQSDFFNTALTGSTALSAEDLLGLLKAYERLHGRRRGRRWGPRPLDLDLLLYGETVSDRPEIEIPHRRLRTRRFYLEPLNEIAPHLTVPPDGVTVSELLGRLPADSAVSRIAWPDPDESEGG